MAQIFPRWTNIIPLKIAGALILIALAISCGIWYYFTPKYTRVGYQPTQPVPFSHALHVNQLGMDCRHCHSFVEKSSHANVPHTQTCINCHSQVKKDSPKLNAVWASWNSGRAIPWIKIHQAPDYVYFDHSAHVNRGISCVHCHGQINEMEVVYHAKPLSMSFCLDCHRAPQEFIRPVDQVYNLDWKVQSREEQLKMGRELVEQWKVNPPVTCEGCHR
ncbi:MAG: cytochrome c3 family protein [Verrucomicrobiae bacterium]|nr:cytochrome c3 family protein [Verrucomicrobiae bacterium]